MKRNLNPHEVRLVAGILDDPAYDTDPDPMAMARDIVRAINTRRERERLWVAGMQVAGRQPTLHGPFLTVAAAIRYIEAGWASLGHDGPVQAIAMPVLSPSELAGDVDEAPDA